MKSILVGKNNTFKKPPHQINMLVNEMGVSMSPFWNNKGNTKK